MLWYCQEYRANWFAVFGVSEVSRQWRRSQRQPPGASCSCTPSDLYEGGNPGYVSNAWSTTAGEIDQQRVET